MPYTIDLSGKHALVTGGTRGIGRAISLKLAEAGATVAMSYRSDEGSAQAALEMLQKLGSDKSHMIVRGDLSTEAEARRVARDSVKAFNDRLDILVLNAGIGGGGALAEISMGEWRKPFETNLFGHVAVLQEAAESMQPGGSVIVISSGAGHDPIEGLSAYGASKAALNQVAAVLAQEWGPRGIRVNVISPGSTATHTPDYNNLTERQKETIAATALRRLGTADDVAGVALFFASELSSFVTGQWVRVNGGRV